MYEYKDDDTEDNHSQGSGSGNDSGSDSAWSYGVSTSSARKESRGSSSNQPGPSSKPRPQQEGNTNKASAVSAATVTGAAAPARAADLLDTATQTVAAVVGGGRGGGETTAARRGGGESRNGSSSSFLTAAAAADATTHNNSGGGGGGGGGGGTPFVRRGSRKSSARAGYDGVSCPALRLGTQERPSSLLDGGIIGGGGGGGRGGPDMREDVHRRGRAAPEAPVVVVRRRREPPPPLPLPLPLPLPSSSSRSSSGPSSSRAMELYEALGTKIRALDATVDTLLERNARLQRWATRSGRVAGLKRSREVDDDDDDDTDDDDDDDEAYHQLHTKRRYDETGTEPQQRRRADQDDAKVGQLEDLVEKLRHASGRLRREIAHKDATIRNQKDQLGRRAEEVTRISLENDRLKAELEAVKDERRSLRNKYKAVRDERNRLRGGGGMDASRAEIPRGSSGSDPPSRGLDEEVGVGSLARAHDVSSATAAAAAGAAAAHEYLEEPVTKDLDKVMRRGVGAFQKFQKGKAHRPLVPGERVYYVCQSCSTCRENPKKAAYTSFKAVEYPNHPLRYPGFASYDVPLPHQARIDLQRHLREKRKAPGVVVADAPAARAPIRPRPT